VSKMKAKSAYPWQVTIFASFNRMLNKILATWKFSFINFTKKIKIFLDHLLEICHSKDLLCGIFCSVPHLSVSSPLDVSFIFLGSPVRTIFSISFSLSIYRSLCIFHRSFCISPNSPVAPFCIFYESLSITSRSPCASGIFLGFSNRETLPVSSRFIPLSLLEIIPDFTVSLPDLLHFPRIPCISPTRRSLTIFHRSLRTEPGSHCISPGSFVPSSRRLILLPDLPTLPFWFFSDHPCISLGFSWISYPCDFFNFI
jgi:hypothetical protein